jgi:hypothetical protein
MILLLVEALPWGSRYLSAVAAVQAHSEQRTKQH